jgi:hypothetical protein
VTARFDLRHATVDFGQASIAPARTDGKWQEDEPELVAELARHRLVERPQVERDHGLDLGNGRGTTLAPAVGVLGVPPVVEVPGWTLPGVVARWFMMNLRLTRGARNPTDQTLCGRAARRAV